MPVASVGTGVSKNHAPPVNDRSLNARQAEPPPEPIDPVTFVKTEQSEARQAFYRRFEDETLAKAVAGCAGSVATRDILDIEIQLAKAPPSSFGLATQPKAFAAILDATATRLDDIILSADYLHKADEQPERATQKLLRDFKLDAAHVHEQRKNLGLLTAGKVVNGTIFIGGTVFAWPVTGVRWLAHRVVDHRIQHAINALKTEMANAQNKAPRVNALVAALRAGTAAGVPVALVNTQESIEGLLILRDLTRLSARFLRENADTFAKASRHWQVYFTRLLQRQARSEEAPRFGNRDNLIQRLNRRSVYTIINSTAGICVFNGLPAGLKY